MLKINYILHSIPLNVKKSASYLNSRLINYHFLYRHAASLKVKLFVLPVASSVALINILKDCSDSSIISLRTSHFSPQRNPYRIT